jgi:uncharacterized protein YegP (UPF0339 family)
MISVYFCIYKSDKLDAKQPYWWVIKSNGNHATLASSEMLTSKEACVHAIQIVAGNGEGSLYYDRTGE